MTKFRFGKRSEQVMNHPLFAPDLRKLSHYALSISQFDFGFGSTSGVRDDDTQLNLFHKGVSQCDGVEKLSRHQPKANSSGFCEAVDFYGYDENGKSVDGSTTKGLLVMTHIALCYAQASIELNIPINSGAFFKGYGTFGDLGHIELS